MEEKRLKHDLSNDKVLNIIHSKFIKLQIEEVKEVKILLDKVVTDVIDRMKSQDSLFERLFNRIVFCGSFYKNTKISKPNEFDLNIILNLSKCTVDPDNINFSFSQPAFVKIAISKAANTLKTRYRLSEKEKKQLNKFIDDGYLNPHKFRNWVEKVLTNSIILKLPLEYNSKIQLVKINKSGPAFTLVLVHLEHREEIHIDIVPALNFYTDVIVYSPVNFKQIEKYSNKEWFAVSVPKNTIDGSDDILPWRQSFFYQEKEILERSGRIKSIIRLMKKLRDTQRWHNVSSYFIETLTFNRLEHMKKTLDNEPLTYLFYLMLKKMQDAFKQHTIEYFWDERYNLLAKISEPEMRNITQRLNRIISYIEKKAGTDPFIIAKYILDKTELEELYEEYNAKQFADLSIGDSVSDNKEENQNTWGCVLF